jgi:hypothetical protein
MAATSLTPGKAWRKSSTSTRKAVGLAISQFR